MANKEHLKILKQGVEVWNNWREENPNVEPDLSEADLNKAEFSLADLSEANLISASLVRTNLINANLSNADLNKAELVRANLREANLESADLRKAKLFRADLSGAKLSGTDLRKADLRRVSFDGAEFIETDFSGADLRRTGFSRANLREAYLSGVDLREADLSEATLRGMDLSEVNLSTSDLSDANLRGANLSEVDLSGANLRKANLKKAILNQANLENANLVETSLEGANISNSRIYGISAWNLKISEETKQINLVITQDNEPVITVDNLEVAQFIYLLLHNEKIRHVIDTITSKVVLILGRFTKPRKAVLDAVRNGLRQRDYLPILFDFDKPASRDMTETISTLAHMARFIIADITDPKSIPQELQAIVPNLPSVPIQPLLFGAATEYGMFEHFKSFPWVLEICRYHDPDELIQSIQTKVIAPAEEIAKSLMAAKSR